MVVFFVVIEAFNSFFICGEIYCGDFLEGEDGDCFSIFCFEELVLCALDGEGFCSELSSCFLSCGDDEDCV